MGRRGWMVAIFICIYNSKLNHSTTNKVYHFKHNFKRNGKHFKHNETRAMLLSVPMQGYLDHQNGFESRLLYAQNTLTTIRHYFNKPICCKEIFHVLSKHNKKLAQGSLLASAATTSFPARPIIFQTVKREQGQKLPMF